MKHPQFKMLLYFLCGLLIMVLTAWLLAGPLALGNATIGMLLAVGFLILAFVTELAAEGSIFQESFNFPAKRRLSRASYLLNAVASGCAVGGVLMDKQIAASPNLFLAILPAAALALLFSFLYCFPGEGLRKAFCVTFLVLTVSLCVGAICLWIFVSTTMGCMALFSGLYLLLFPIGLRHAVRAPKEWSRYLSYTGFGAFFMVFIAALLILSDGEALDGVDLDFGHSSRKKKRLQ